MTDPLIPRIAPENENDNPASELKTDVVRDVERDDTITGDFTATDDDPVADGDHAN